VKIVVGFHFFREHLHIQRQVSLRQTKLIRGRSSEQVHLDKIRHGDQRLPIRPVLEIVQSQQVASLFQAPARVVNFVVQGDRF
jgi:hypothetical protein